jgi:hypothetical protein
MPIIFDATFESLTIKLAASEMPRMTNNPLGELKAFRK